MEPKHSAFERSLKLISQHLVFEDCRQARVNWARQASDQEIIISYLSASKQLKDRPDVRVLVDRLQKQIS